MAALPGRRRKQGMDAPIGPAGHSRGRSRSAVSSPDGMAARRRCDRRTHPLTAVAATDPADVGPVPHRRRLGHAARPRSCRGRDSVRRSAPGRARPARRAAPRLRFPEPSVPAGGADGPDPPVGCPTWSPRRSGVGAAQGARDRRAHLDQLGGRRPRRVPLAADGGPERRRRRSGCTVAGDGGDVGEAGDACGHQALGVAGVTQLARISRPPGPDCAVTVQRVPGSRECGGLFAAISYPVLYAKSAGIQARGGNGVGVCSFDRFLPQGVTTRPLGEARTRNVFAATAGIGLWNRGSRADPHDRGDRGVRKSTGRLDSHAQ